MTDRPSASSTPGQCNKHPPKQTGKTMPQPFETNDIYEELDVKELCNITPIKLQVCIQMQY